MADDITCEVLGLDELQQALEQLPDKVATKGLRAALKDGAAPVVTAMVAMAPKDTGFLAEHFNVKIKLDRRGIAGSAFIGPAGKIDYPAYMSGAYNIVRNAAGRTKMVGKIAVATIARFLEFGTQKMSKKPFMTQAFETTKETAASVMQARLWLAVEDSARELNKGPRI